MKRMRITESCVIAELRKFYKLANLGAEVRTVAGASLLKSEALRGSFMGWPTPKSIKHGRV